MKLLIATTNPAKLAEYREHLSALPVELVGLSDLGVVDSPEETGATMRENALLKARFYAVKFGMMTLADDGGFEIDALNGEPGVKSRRWPGYEASDEELIKMVFDRLRGVPSEKRTARMRSVTVVVAPDGSIVAEAGEKGLATEGMVPDAPSSVRQHGFPFRSVLFLTEYKKYYVELTPAEMAATSQRSRAIAAIIPALLRLCEERTK